jgi:hypothetical protein
VSIDQNLRVNALQKKRERRSLKLLEAQRAEGPKWILSIGQHETHVNRSKILGKTLREFQWGVETPEARRAEEPRRIWTVRSRGYMVKDRELWVKVLREKMKE